MVGDIFQPTHLLLILVVALLVLGPKRLPEVGRAVGRSLHDFRGAINGEHHEAPEPVERVVSPESPKPAAEPADRVV
jgi:sec-independent protein translocase protein TatA